MARLAKKRMSKDDIKAAAKRAEKRSKGEKITKDASPLEPPVTAGRPTEYDPSYCDIAASACARGATIAEVADILGVARWTIYRWMALHEAFGAAIKVAREIADERVGFSLYERAVGYTYDSVKIMQSDGTPLIVPYKEHVPPDVGAQKMWLTNRDPVNWKERVSKEISGPGGGPIEVSSVDKLALARWIALQLITVPEVRTIE